MFDEEKKEGKALNLKRRKVLRCLSLDLFITRVCCFVVFFYAIYVTCNGENEITTNKGFGNV